MTTSKIICRKMKQSVFDAYKEEINAFSCGSSGEAQELNRNLRNSLNLDVTTLIFLCKNSGDIIAYCSYRCSAIKWHIANQPDDLFPAMEVVSFAVSEKYQGKYYIPNDNLKYSDYTFQYCLNRLKFISRTHIRATHIILFCLDEVRPKKFYQRNFFDYCPPGFFPAYRADYRAMVHKI